MTGGIRQCCRDALKPSHRGRIPERKSGEQLRRANASLAAATVGGQEDGDALFGPLLFGIYRFRSISGKQTGLPVGCHRTESCDQLHC